MVDKLRELGIDFDMYREYKDAKVRVVIKKEGKNLWAEGRLKELLLLLWMIFKYGGEESLGKGTDRMAGERKGRRS